VSQRNSGYQRPPGDTYELPGLDNANCDSVSARSPPPACVARERSCIETGSGIAPGGTSDRRDSDPEQLDLFDHIAEDKLRRALEAACYDGSEVHCVIDRELRGFEFDNAARAIKRAVENKFCNTAPIDAVIEIVCKLLEGEE
jgi:hypothetical protein